MEVRIGYDGIVFASFSRSTAPTSPRFEPADMVQRHRSPKVMKDGALVDNSFTPCWAEFNADLPAAVEIAMFIPGTKHGTREVFEEKVLAVIGCEETGAMEAMIAGGHERKMTPKMHVWTVRTDGKLGRY